MMIRRFGLIAILAGVLPLAAPWGASAAGQEVPSLPEPSAIPPLVDHEKLRAFLPEPPAGWSAEKPESSTTDTDEIRLSSAQRTYSKGMEEGSPSATVTIIDSTNNASFFDVAKKNQWEEASENEEGYDKRIEIDGMRAIEHYNKAAKTGSLSVFVGNRYFVQVELTNVDPKELREWLQRIDTRRLAELK